MALGLCASSAFGSSSIDLSRPASQSLPEIIGVYWPFDEMIEGADGVFADSGNLGSIFASPGNGKTPGLTPGVDRPGTSGYAMALQLSTSATEPGGDGNPRVLVNLPPENPLIMSGKDFSGGVWIKFDSTLAGENQLVMLLDRGGFQTRTGPGEGHFSFFILKNPKEMWQMGFETGDGEQVGTATTADFQAWELQDGGWHHLGFNFASGADGEGGAVTFWLDGQLVDEATVDVGIRGGMDSTTRRFSVGERAVSLYRSVFNGALDDLFVTEGIHTFTPLTQ